MRWVVVGVGANLGGREASIRAAALLLDARPGIDVERVSPLYETEPLGPPQPHYLNAAFRLKSALPPPGLLDALLRTERRLGRRRSQSERWGPRSIDLDLLWDDAGPHASPGLTVPHAELARRTFALAPLLDVAPELRASFAECLAEQGGAPPPWTRSAIVVTRTSSDGFHAQVESDSLADACALAAASVAPVGRPWSTRHVTIRPGAEPFAAALRQALRTGFSVARATISHCSDAQWTAEFHGVNAGMPVDADVRLQPTSGTQRAVRVELSVNAPPR